MLKKYCIARGGLYIVPSETIGKISRIIDYFGRRPLRIDLQVRHRLVQTPDTQPIPLLQTLLGRSQAQPRPGPVITEIQTSLIVHIVVPSAPILPFTVCIACLDEQPVGISCHFAVIPHE